MKPEGIHNLISYAISNASYNKLEKSVWMLLGEVVALNEVSMVMLVQPLQATEYCQPLNNYIIIIQ